MSGESLERVEGLRIAGPGEVTHAGEDAHCSGHGQPKLLDLYGDLTCQNRSGGGAVDDDVIRLVGLEQLFVDSDGVIESGGEGKFWREAVEHCDDLDLGHARHRDRFGERAGVGVESAAMEA